MIDEAKLLYLQEINDSQNHGVTKDDIGKLIAALRAAWADNKRLREAQEWRPIESAPRDKPFLLAISWTDWIDGMVIHNDEIGISQFEQGRLNVPLRVGSEGVKILGWMPLPEPPKE